MRTRAGHGGPGLRLDGPGRAYQAVHGVAGREAGAAGERRAFLECLAPEGDRAGAFGHGREGLNKSFLCEWLVGLLGFELWLWVLWCKVKFGKSNNVIPMVRVSRIYFSYLT